MEAEKGLTVLLEWSLGCENLGRLVLQEKGNPVEEAGCGLCSTVRVQGREPRGQSATDHDYDGHFPQESPAP